MSVKLVDIILSERAPTFFSAAERDMGIELVQSLISGDSSLLSHDDKYLAEVSIILPAAALSLITSQI